MRGGQVADGAEHVGLGRDIEAGGRLVEHDDTGAAGEGDGEPDALLLAARQLVRIVAKEARRVRQRDLAHHFGDPRATLVRALAKVVSLEHFTQLGSDAQRGVEGRCRILRDVADDAAAQAGALRRIQLQHLDVTDAHRASLDLRAAPGVAEKGEPNGRLAGSGFADEPEDFARGDAERDIVDDV